MRKIICLLFVLLACEGPKGPVGPVGPEGPAGEVKEKIVVVAIKMYTSGNPNWATLYYDDTEVDENTVVIYAGYMNPNGVWTNVEAVNSYYCCNINASGKYGYDGRSGLAALIYDSDGDLLGYELKILYIP